MNAPPDPDPRARLLAERQRTVARLAQLNSDFDGIVEASRDTNADDEHDPEGATIAFERSQIDALVRQAERQVEQIDQALRRLDADGYGICEVCGTPIPVERLEARPTALRCIGCAR
ncbi:TraR/DksA family transcriptional regulator [Nocardioides sp.]|uniref:TraR/DksA family transcriptional regulator n=1 Tax=Nocardioides sp. TaxID=35761 RepID=UPI003D0DFA69